ncbi:MAG: hypothetical protein AB1793_08230 [Candidatus Thermoplasmatota archaeon]
MNRGILLGIALLAVGAALAAFAYDAHSEIGGIGDTDDPDLQERLDTLEERRTAFTVSAAGALFLGAFAVAVLSLPSVPASVSAAQMMSAARSNRDLVGGRSLEGGSVYLPAREGVPEKVFVPAEADGPVSRAHLTDGSGILVDPPGGELLAAIERERGPMEKGMDMEAVEGGLRMLGQGMGMMRDFHLKEREGRLVLRVEYGGLRDACRAVRAEMPDTCRQLQCVGCSCILTAVARATDRAVRVEKVDNSQDRVVFTLSLSEW